LSSARSAGTAAAAVWLAGLTAGAGDDGVICPAPDAMREPVAGSVAEITAAARKRLIFSHLQTVQDPRCHDVAVEGFYAFSSASAKEMSAASRRMKPSASPVTIRRRPWTVLRLLTKMRFP
jgi:hypothetical protein